MDNAQLTWLIFFTLLGACVGSFLNVVILRLPMGISVVHPPSHDFESGQKLKWWENIPVLSYILLRGRSRYSGKPISIQYPLIEAFTAALFGGWFLLCYVSDWQPAMSGPGFYNTWPIFVAHLFLIGALLAATVIDARFYIIPLAICWWVSAVGLLLPIVAWLRPRSITAVQMPEGMFRSDILLAVPAPYDNAAAVHHAALLGETEATVTMLPWIGDAWIMAALLGSVGLAASVVLLLLGILPRSFELDQPEADLTITTDDAEPAEEPEELPLHPHPRREVGKELLFLGIPLLGFLVGWIVFHDLFTGSPWVLRVLGGVLIGYLVGGGIVWAVRILGTLGFGKEAMGLGDVHLMAAVGAVCGWQIAVIAFFVAPFFGLAYALLAFGAGRLMKREVRVIPYGPHLAVATLVVLAGREWLLTEFMLRFHL